MSTQKLLVTVPGVCAALIAFLHWARPVSIGDFPPGMLTGVLLGVSILALAKSRNSTSA